jgi:hypothetical protein
MTTGRSAASCQYICRRTKVFSFGREMSSTCRLQAAATEAPPTVKHGYRAFTPASGATEGSVAKLKAAE